jgi:hypothetical protein
MNKTTKYVLIGAAVLGGLYLITAKSSPLKLGTGTAGTGTGGAAYITASGAAANGFSNLWDSIFNSSSSEES